MHFILSLASLAAVSTLVSANPLPQHLVKRGRFSVSQRQTKHTSRLGAVAHRRTYLKYGVTPPEHINAAAEAAIKAATNVNVAADGNGTVSAEPDENDVQYLSPVTVAGTELMLDFDTGSADLWVYSSLQPSTESTNHAVFDVSQATELQGATWMISYGDGSSAGGKVYTGTVEIGGVTATDQAIEAASDVSAAFEQDENSDGLVGLAFSSINTVQPTAQKTWFDNVADQLESPLFTATLKKGAVGTYDFGFLDSSKYTGDITYTDVDSSNGFWEVTVDSYAIGDGDDVANQFSTIIDTGSSLWYMPSAAVTAYYSQISSAQIDNTQGGYVFDCSEELPSASVTIGGTKFTVPGTFMNYADTGLGSCFGGIQDAGELPYTIFGDVFLKAHYAVFDSNGPRFGLAPQAGVGGSNNSSGTNSTPTANPTSTLPTPTPAPTSSLGAFGPAATESGTPTFSLPTPSASLTGFEPEATESSSGGWWSWFQGLGHDHGQGDNAALDEFLDKFKTTQRKTVRQRLGGRVSAHAPRSG